MTTSCLATRVETWLSSTWHVKVPAQWLEACIDWIQQENGGFSLAQASLNKQVFEQWLFTDLRDLEYPVLPDCLLNYPKGELNGFYSIQIDSLVDVSQPAYSQLQKLRGKNTVNEEITANTERIVRSWEAKPSRMLMLQLTDGVHHIQGMEYHSVPVLHCDLPPGTKVMIQGNVVYRLGVLLLKPENVRLLGGKVDSLIEENAKERILTRLLGEGDENSPNGVVSNNGECVIPQPIDEISQGLGPSDEELLASLEENNELMISEAPVESGYCTRSTRLNSTTYSLPPNTGNYLQQGAAVFTEEQNMQGDFDDFPLDDDLFLVEEIQQEERQDLNRNTSVKNQPAGEKNPGEGMFAFVESTRDFSTKRNVKCTQNLDDCLESRSNKGNEKSSSISNNKLTDINVESQQSSECVQAYKIKNKCLAVGLDTPPFTYLSLLLSNKPKDITTVKIKAFIVTLTGNLTSSNGFWSVAAKISDGTAFLEVDFADEILTSLIGFSVPEMKQLRKDPVLFPKLKEGLQNCQRELIDLCCLMTVEFNPSQTKARVIILQDINENDLNNLKRRLYV